MPITRLTDSFEISANEVLVLGFTQTDSSYELLESALPIDPSLKLQINQAIKLTSFSAKKSEITYLTINSGVLCVGLGKIEKTEPIDLETLRRAAGTASRSLVGKNSALFALPNKNLTQTHAVVMGVELGAYSFQEFKTKKDDKNSPLQSARILVTEVKNNQKIFEEAQIIAESVLNVRNLVNTPPSHMYPSVFADYVKKSFKRGSKVTLEILDEKMLKKKGYGALIGVGQGSVNPP